MLRHNKIESRRNIIPTINPYSKMDSRQFFVKSDNIIVPSELKGTQVLDIPKNGSIKDLYTAIRLRYKLPDSCTFQLWTGPMGMRGKRFDNQDEIINPQIENVLIRFVGKGHSINPHIHH